MGFHSLKIIDNGTDNSNVLWKNTFQPNQSRELKMHLAKIVPYFRCRQASLKTLTRDRTDVPWCWWVVKIFYLFIFDWKLDRPNVFFLIVKVFNDFCSGERVFPFLSAGDLWDQFLQSFTGILIKLHKEKFSKLSICAENIFKTFDW